MSVSSEIVCTFLFGMEFAKTSAFKRKDAILNESNDTIIEIQFFGIEPYSISYRLAKQMAFDRSSLMKWLRCRNTLYAGTAERYCHLPSGNACLITQDMPKCVIRRQRKRQNESI